MLERVRRGGKARFGETRRDQPGMRRAAGVERLCHRAEIGHDPAALGSRQCQGVGRPRGIEMP